VQHVAGPVEIEEVEEIGPPGGDGPEREQPDSDDRQSAS
jgi:hypothetical protein